VLFPGSSQTPLRFAFEVGEISPGVPEAALGFSIVTAAVIHNSGAPSTAVRLAAGGKTLAYSGDTEWTDELIPIAAGVDLLIVECYDYARDLKGHMSFAKLMEKRALLAARRIMLTHMNPTMLARTAEAAAQGFLVAEDGLVVDL